MGATSSCLTTSLWLINLKGGMEKFHIHTERRATESDQEFQSRVVKDERAARAMRMQEQDHIARILENMKKDKPWAKMDGKIAWKRSLKENYNREFAGQTEVDADCIRRYLNHPTVINFYDELLEFASRSEAPSGVKHQAPSTSSPLSTSRVG